MKELEKLQERGWIFTIWLVSNGSCIIQGKLGDDPGDFDFDIQAGNFSLAARRAVWEVKMRLRKSQGGQDEN